jgi:hypothetical protein
VTAEGGRYDSLGRFTLAARVRLRSVVLASYAANVDVGLIVTFGGVGVVVTGLIAYIVAQAMGERADNQRTDDGETAV